MYVNNRVRVAVAGVRAVHWITDAIHTQLRYLSLNSYTVLHS